MSPSWGGGTGTQGGRAIGVEASGIPIVGRGTGTVSGGGLILYIAGGEGSIKCSFFLILVSEDSNNYFEIFLVLSRTQKTISGLPPFSPPPWAAAGQRPSRPRPPINDRRCAGRGGGEGGRRGKSHSLSQWFGNEINIPQ